MDHARVVARGRDFFAPPGSCILQPATLATPSFAASTRMLHLLSLLGMHAAPFERLMLEGTVPLQGELLQQALRPAERAYLQQRTPPSLAQHEAALGLRKQETTALGPAARPGGPAITLNGRPLPCWIAPYASYAANSSDACKPGKRAARRGSLLTRWSAVMRDERRGHAPPLARMLRRVGRLLFVGDSIVEQMAAAAMCELLRSVDPADAPLVSRISYTSTISAHISPISRTAHLRPRRLQDLLLPHAHAHARRQGCGRAPCTAEPMAALRRRRNGARFHRWPPVLIVCTHHCRRAGLCLPRARPCVLYAARTHTSLGCVPWSMARLDTVSPVTLTLTLTGGHYNNPLDRATWWSREAVEGKLPLTNADPNRASNPNPSVNPGVTRNPHANPKPNPNPYQVPRTRTL